MTITYIYELYEIPPNLAHHQLTVAAVAYVICNMTHKGTMDTVVNACLLHDMGNIIKFDFDKKIKGAEIEDVDYWKSIQKRFIETYGHDEHHATMAIAEEIGVDTEVQGLIDAMGFRHSLITLQSNNISKIIAAYSDMRVAPHGVVSLETRLSDLTKRYGTTTDQGQYQQAFKDMESKIFAETTITADMITQEVVDIQKQKLANFEIRII